MLWSSWPIILKEERSNLMKTFNRQTLSELVERRQLQPARQLSVGQLRIATIPRVLRPERSGQFDPQWLEVLPVVSNDRRANVLTVAK